MAEEEGAAAAATLLKEKSSGDDKVALVVGATGLVGRELVRILNESPEWKLVYGLARKPDDEYQIACCGDDKYRFVGCDLLDGGETMGKLRHLAEQVTHLFWVTWASQFQLDTKECCDQNRAMLSNTLDALLILPNKRNSSALTHVSLQTGTKHYMSFNTDADSSDWCCYYHDEESPRVGEVPNFYYALEDLVKERLSVRKGTISSPPYWSVHRPGMILGASRRSHFNIVGSLCVYGSICRHLGLPFLFGGDRRCWEEPYMDASDARLVARQQIWWGAAANTLDGEAFNAVNVTTFAWKEIWPALASTFGVKGGGEGPYLVAEEMRYGPAMGDMGGVWDEIVEKEGLRRTRMDELANWWFLDAMFRFPGKEKLLVRRPTKAHRLGFTDTYSATESLLYWVDRMREERLIP